ncbi:hypothetical protein A9P82_08895 [Arachidicoccus ginsenosidimutans]|uniref:hypothetical protein n=1 Tax=Arachidicoccus sp. BS20 TaxID=1850526 RepID=UPI0007F1215C|nr:hypothetical protein [Arachidicoccus sp. BS20]ANI89400.1 hypothetical protein A9P82_08895 [Arachidicoccus sp. BS20]
MTQNEIEGFLSGRKNKTGNSLMNIRFKKRADIDGIIIRSTDFEDLKEKNFWRIILLKDLSLWENTHNIHLSRIFNGHDFKKLVYSNR